MIDKNRQLDYIYFKLFLNKKKNQSIYLQLLNIYTVAGSHKCARLVMSIAQIMMVLLFVGPQSSSEESDGDEGNEHHS